jgi:predicted protein tyrosine phosphatase
LAHLLFICSKNQWRSPTAEKLFKNHAVHRARSAGTSTKARIKINYQHIAWADVIFVMERKHRNLIKERYAMLLTGKEIVVLNIKDLYQFNDPELVSILNLALAEYL